MSQREVLSVNSKLEEALKIKVRAERQAMKYKERVKMVGSERDEAVQMHREAVKRLEAIEM